MSSARSTVSAVPRLTAGVLLALGLAVPASAQLAEAPASAPPAAVAAVSPGAAGARPLPPPLETAFALNQLRYDRVREARVQSRFAIKQLFRERGLSYPAAELFLRIFKRERVLEVWVRSPGTDRFGLLRSYDICALAGELGPKRRQGDMQVPEGFYYVDHFNPQSEYLLSLHVDYPNRSDAILGDGSPLGGDIFIHGGCNSEGCIAITNEGIRELYWLSVETRGAGQARIPVHIFPARLNDTDLPLLTSAFAGRPALTSFWQNLKPGYDYFEQHGRIPLMAVTDRGEYRIVGEDLGQPAAAQPGSRAPRGTRVRPGPVPLGTPVGAPLGTPVPGPAATDAPSPAATDTLPATPAAPASPAKGPVPLGRPVGGGR